MRRCSSANLYHRHLLSRDIYHLANTNQQRWTFGQTTSFHIAIRGDRKKLLNKLFSRRNPGRRRHRL
jgi:hypothetical protein